MINIDQAVNNIQQGKVIAYPTEAVYGLGCNPFDEQAFNNLLTIKNRPIEKGVILIAANIEQIKHLVKLEDQSWTTTILNSWQQTHQAITWVIPITKLTPSWITGGRKTLAVRITHHKTIIELCNKLQSPLVSTSANLSQQVPAKTSKECLDIFPNIAILEGKTLGLTQPSQIWDALSLTRLR